MERNAFWVFIGIGVAFGLSIELLKSPSDADKIKAMADGTYEFSDDRIEDIDAARAGRIKGVANADSSFGTSGATKNKVANVAGIMPHALTKEAGINKTKGVTKPGAAKNDKKKKAAKKKVKKKRKTIKSKDQQPATDEFDETESDETEDTQLADDTTTYGGALAPAAAPAAEDEIPQELHDWENLVLREPDFKATEKLIKFYQSNIIGPDIFYTVVRQMVEDPRPKMQELGVMALGATPSVRSFAELVVVIEGESGVTTLKSQAQRYIKSYTQIQHVRLLGGAMQLKESPSVALEAMRLLRISVDQNLKGSDARTPAEQGEIDMASQTGTAIQAGTSSTVKKFDAQAFYRPFVKLLENLVQTYTDPELKSAASQTLSHLQSLISEEGTSGAIVSPVAENSGAIQKMGRQWPARRGMRQGY